MKAKGDSIIFLIFLLIVFNLLIREGLGSGLIIHKVFSGSLAERAGLRVGDQILEINGKQVYALRPFQRQVLQLLSNNSPFSLRVKRGEKILDFFLVPQGETFLGITISSREDTEDSFGESVEMAPKQDIKVVLDKYENLKRSSENKKKLFKKEIENLPPRPKDYVDKARELLHSAETVEELELVAQLLEKAKILFPEEENIYFNLGLLYDTLEDYEKAIINLREYKRRAIKISKKDIEEIEQLMAKNEENLKKLEDVKRRMVEGYLTKILEIPDDGSKRRPSSKDSSVKFLKINEDIYLQHPRIYLLSRNFSLWERMKEETLTERSLRKNIEKEPRIKVFFKGKRFEIRYMTLEIVPPSPGESQYNFVYSWFLTRGFMEFQGDNSFITLTHFRQTRVNKINPSTDIWEFWEKEWAAANKALWKISFEENLSEFYGEQKFRVQ